MPKLDVKRIYIMFFSVVLAIFFKLAIDSVPVLSGLPAVAGFALSPILALIVSQMMIEKKLDGKEVVLFFIFMFASNFVLQLFPSVRDFNLFSLTTGTTIGIIVTIMAYLITVPISVLFADAITDKGINIFKGRR